MSSFDPRAFARAVPGRARKVLVLGVAFAVLLAVSGLITGGFASSPSIFTQAKRVRFLPVCVQRSGPNVSKGDLNVRIKDQCAAGQKVFKLALFPAGGKRGPKGSKGTKGAQGPQGPKGSQGPQGPPGTAANQEFGVANVFVDRGNGPSRFATFSVALGSPAGSTTSGSFRFTCTPAQSPCKVSLGAAVISTRSGNASLFPRILIHKQADLAGAPPISFCEYADGGNNNLGVDLVPRVPSLKAAVGAMQTKLNMGIGGSLDCGSAQVRPPSGTVQEIWVPSASDFDSAFFDVSVTLQFR